MVLHAKRGANTSFAIDDIKLTPGECKHMEDYIYTFDELENLDVNRIEPLSGGIGVFYRPKFKSLYPPNAPVHDHTTGSGGYFLFMNNKKDYNTTYQTEVVIDNLPKMPVKRAIKGRCLKFAYQIVGQAKLKVSVDDVNSNNHNYPIFSSIA